MFSQWSTKVVRLLNSQLGSVGVSIPEGEGDNYVVDLEAVRAILPSFPNNTLHDVASLCGSAISPVYNGFRGMIVSDIENITQLLSDLEAHYDGDEVPQEGFVFENSSDNASLTSSSRNAHSTPSEMFQSKRRRASASTEIPIIIPSTHPVAPSILITPCGSQGFEQTCRVPCQDSAFGNLLTVPSHPTYNAVHPPMLPPRIPVSPLQNWRWRRGHWECVLPSIREQTRRGLFSKAQSIRRKACRPCDKAASKTSRTIFS